MCTRWHSNETYKTSKASKVVCQGRGTGGKLVPAARQRGCAGGIITDVAVMVSDSAVTFTVLTDSTKISAQIAVMR